MIVIAGSTRIEGNSFGPLGDYRDGASQCSFVTVGSKSDSKRECWVVVGSGAYG